MRQRRRQKQRKAAGVVGVPGHPGDQEATVITWESEVRAIAREATAWAVETGGDLFGLWEPTPVIYLATRVGPNAVRDTAHFRLDVEYLRSLSDILATDWGIRYLGDWHSHHRLQLMEPSSGDRQRIKRLAARNHFPGMAEIIVTFLGDGMESPSVRLDPWTYHGGDPLPTSATIAILPGVSPVREALVARGSLPEQELERWPELPPSRVLALEGTRPPGGETITGLAEPMSRCLLAQAHHVLEQVATGPVEEHPAPFGVVLVAPAGSAQLVAVAVNDSWPCDILEIDWIDRDRRTSDVVDAAAPANLLDPNELAALYGTVLKLKEAEGEESHVDRGST